MMRGGVEEFELYVRDDIAVCILEARDLDTYFDTIEGDDAVADWEHFTGRFKRSGVDADAPPDEGIPFIDRIWRFAPDEEPDVGATDR